MTNWYKTAQAKPGLRTIEELLKTIPPAQAPSLYEFINDVKTSILRCKEDQGKSKCNLSGLFYRVFSILDDYFADRDYASLNEWQKRVYEILGHVDWPQEKQESYSLNFIENPPLVTNRDIASWGV